MAAMVGAQGDAPAELRVRFHAGWKAWVVKIKEMQVTAKFPVKQSMGMDMALQRT